MNHTSHNLSLVCILGASLLVGAGPLKANSVDDSFADRIRSQTQQAGSEVLAGVRGQLQQDLFEPGRDALERLRPLSHPGMMLADEPDSLLELPSVHIPAAEPAAPRPGHEPEAPASEG